MSVEPAAAVVALAAAAVFGWFVRAIIDGAIDERNRTALQNADLVLTEHLALAEPTEPVPVVSRPRMRIGPVLRSWAERTRADLGEWWESVGPDRHDGWTAGELASARARWDPAVLLPVVPARPAIPTPQQLKFHLVRHVPREIRKQRAQRWAR